jgi:hydrogenase nickel incorporation protein HypB
MCGVCGCGVEEEEKAVVHSNAHSHTHAHGHEGDHPHPHDHEGEHSHPHDHDHDRLIRLEQAVLAKNDRFAERNRGFFGARGVLALNLTSSPGAGKTTLLERTIRDLSEIHMAVIEGDQETDNDARRIRATGCRAIQINTGAGCHLDAERVGIAARNLAPPRGSVVFIENVGNLVCPAMFDLGENAKVVVVSVTEGEDKPIKYPHMFRAASAMVLSKTDLLPHLEFDVGACLAYARRVNSKLRIFPVSVQNGDGLVPLYEWMRERLAQAEEDAQ